MIDPESLRTAVLLLAVTVAGIDLGVASMMRAMREAGSDSEHD